MSFSSYIKQNDPNLTEEQAKKITEHEEYLKQHKIPEIFKELLAKIILERPDESKVKELMISELKKFKMNKSNAYLFTQKDFEIVFDTYNVLRQDKVSYDNLIQALQNFGVKDAENILNKKYPILKKGNLVTKDQFIDILAREYKNMFE